MYPCRACHLNYGFEEFTIIHTKAGIRCDGCHDAFESHLLDEEQQFSVKNQDSRETFMKSCLECHPVEKNSSELHTLYVSDTGRGQDCFDCHGTHRGSSHR